MSKRVKAKTKLKSQPSKEANQSSDDSDLQSGKTGLATSGGQDEKYRALSRVGDVLFGNSSILLLVIAASLWGIWVSKDTPPKVDEPYHYAQIMMFVEGNWTMLKVNGMEYPFFAMLPGYHAVTALIFGNLRVADPFWMRCFNVICGLVIFLLALTISWRIEGKANFIRAAQVYFSPFAFPFYFLLYSDVFSLLTVMAIFLAMLFKWRMATAISTACCLLVRQSHIVIVALLAALSINDAFFRDDQSFAKRAKDSAKAILPFLPSFILFLAFFVWNGRVPLCSPHLQQTSTLGWNVLLFFSLASIWLAPVQVAVVKESWRFVLKNKLLTSIVFLLVIVLISRLWIEDPRNRRLEELLRNYLMHFVLSDVGTYMLFAMTCIWGLLCTLASKWIHPIGRVTLGVVILTMGPIMLVEPRYFIPASCWSLLFRSHQSAGVERAQLVWMCLLSIGLHWFQSTSIYLM